MSESTRTKPAPRARPPAANADGQAAPPPRRVGRLAYLLPTLLLLALGLIVCANLLVMLALLTRSPAPQAPNTGSGQTATTALRGPIEALNRQTAEMKQQVDGLREGVEQVGKTSEELRKKAQELGRVDPRALQAEIARLQAVAVELAARGKDVDGLKGEVDRLRRLLGEPIAPAVPEDVLLVAIQSANGLDLLAWQDAVLDLFAHKQRLWGSKNYRLGLEVNEGGVEKSVIGLTADNYLIAWRKNMAERTHSRQNLDTLAPRVAEVFAKAKSPPRRRVVLLAGSDCPAPPDHPAWQGVTVHAVLIATGDQPYPPPQAAQWQAFCARQQGEFVCLSAKGQKEETKVRALKLHLQALVQP